MNLVERLMAVDSKKISEIETKTIPSKQLSRLTGQKEMITIQAIDGDLFGSLSASGLDNDGEVDYGRAYSTNAKIVAAGVIEPNLKDDALVKHVGAATPADAAKALFKGEVNKIAAEISKLSGFESEEDTEEKVKN